MERPSIATLAVRSDQSIVKSVQNEIESRIESLKLSCGEYIDMQQSCSDLGGGNATQQLEGPSRSATHLMSSGQVSTIPHVVLARKSQESKTNEGRQLEQFHEKQRRLNTNCS